jgi:uncharacterized protein (UPF0332 family)
LTPEQKALLEKAQESLGAAELLAKNEYFDFAVSRAYYTMFYVAEAFLLGEGSAFSKHSSVIASFGQLFAKSGRIPSQFHRYLIEAGDSRNVGDYDSGSGLSKEDVELQISRAKEFLVLAKEKFSFK